MYQKPTCIITIPFNEKQKELILSSNTKHEILFLSETELTPDLLSNAEIIMGNISPDLVKSAENLRWFQLNSAGANPYIPEGILSMNTLLTSAVGAYDVSVCEGMLAGTFALLRKTPDYLENQKSHAWKDEGPVVSPYNAVVLILGFGNIGSRYAKVMKALGSHIIGIKTRLPETLPEFADEIYTTDHLHECLERADLVVSVLPSTKATYQILGREELGKMKKSAYLINFGRGDAIDTEALCDSLFAGEIAGAALDVTDPEPLPKDHRLWDAPNLVLTPHVSGGFHISKTLDNIAEICAENLRHFENEEPLRNLVDRTRGY